MAYPLKPTIKNIPTTNKFNNEKEIELNLIHNLEFILILINKFNINPQNIDFITTCEIKQRIAENLGVNCVYKFERYEKLFIKEFSMKFDVILGNPPYSEKAGGNYAGKIWVIFLEKILKINKDAIIALITPNNFLLPHHKSYKLISKTQINYMCPTIRNRFFPTISEQIGYFILNINSNNNIILDENNNILNCKFGDVIPLLKIEN